MIEQWVEQCMRCSHSYYRQDDAEIPYCRCRKGCHFKDAGRHIDMNDVYKTADKIEKRLDKLFNIKGEENGTNK